MWTFSRLICEQTAKPTRKKLLSLLLGTVPASTVLLRPVKFSPSIIIVARKRPQLATLCSNYPEWMEQVRARRAPGAGGRGVCRRDEPEDALLPAVHSSSLNALARASPPQPEIQAASTIDVCMDRGAVLEPK
jgi:hypothetical protein